MHKRILLRYVSEDDGNVLSVYAYVPEKELPIFQDQLLDTAQHGFGLEYAASHMLSYLQDATRNGLSYMLMEPKSVKIAVTIDQAYVIRGDASSKLWITYCIGNTPCFSRLIEKVMTRKDFEEDTCHT